MSTVETKLATIILDIKLGEPISSSDSVIIEEWYRQSPSRRKFVEDLNLVDLAKELFSLRHAEDRINNPQ